ncbi:MAG: hypothetical protein H6640_08425 [Caldilineaceae bacterium]|nr:hypothetical protein [Caldilineaceae bacterium]
MGAARALYVSAGEALVAAEALRAKVPPPRRAELTELERLIARNPRIEAIDANLVSVALKPLRATASIIMTPRVDVVALPASADLDTAVATILDSSHHRIPVYGDTLDDVRGILHAEALLETLHAQRTGRSIDDLLRAPLFPNACILSTPSRPCKNGVPTLRSSSTNMAAWPGLLALADILRRLSPSTGGDPAGPFLGSDKRKDDQAYDDELPQHTMTLPAYRMARSAGDGGNLPRRGDRLQTGGTAGLHTSGLVG